MEARGDPLRLHAQVIAEQIGEMHAAVEDPASAGVALKIAPAPLAQALADILPVESPRLADPPTGNGPLPGALGRRATVIFSHDQNPPVVEGRVENLASSAQGNSQRLFDDHVFARRQTGHGQQVVLRVQRTDIHRLNTPRPLEHLFDIGIDCRLAPLKAGDLLRALPRALLHHIATSHDLNIPYPRLPQGLQATHVRPGHPPAADEGQLQPLHTILP